MEKSKGRNFILIVNVPITSLAGNGADGPKRMRGRIKSTEFALHMKD